MRKIRQFGAFLGAGSAHLQPNPCRCFPSLHLRLFIGRRAPAVAPGGGFLQLAGGAPLNRMVWWLKGTLAACHSRSSTNLQELWHMVGSVWFLTFAVKDTFFCKSQPVFIRVALCMSDGMEQAQIQLQAMITARKKNMPHRTPAVASRSKKRPSLWVASLWWFGRQGPLGFKGIGVEIPALNNGATAWCDVLARCRACLLLGDMFARPASSDYRLQFPRSNFLRGKRIGTNNEAMLGHSA